MKKFDRIILKINFTKVFIVYLIGIILVSLTVSGFLGYQFRDKLSFLYSYNQFSEKLKKNENINWNVQEDLSKLAGKSSDVVDILILNKENRIVYSAKNSVLAEKNEFVLSKTNSEKDHSYLVDKQIPNTYFKLVKHNKIFFSKQMVENDKYIKDSYNDDYFYENDFHNRQIFLLSYLTDKTTGFKIYFISDVQPVPYGEIYLEIVVVIVALFLIAYWILVALWIYVNAKKSKLNAPLWGIAILLTNLAGVLVYFIFKQNSRTCFKCGAVQSNANIYCIECGVKMTETCEQCNLPLTPNARYCGRCGKEVCKE